MVTKKMTLVSCEDTEKVYMLMALLAQILLSRINDSNILKTTLNNANKAYKSYLTSNSLTALQANYMDSHTFRVNDGGTLARIYTRNTEYLYKGSATAKNSYVMSPGARITNAVGQVGFKTTHNIDYYKNLNSQAVYNTGPITRYLNDR